MKGTSYTDKKVKRSTIYKYKVRPYRYVNGKKSYGRYSYGNSAAPGVDAGNYTLELSQSEDNIAIGVDASTADCSANKKTALIYRSTEKDGSYKKIKALTFKPDRQFCSATYESRFADKEVSGGQIYYYRIKIKKVINGKTYTSKFSAPKAVSTISIEGDIVVDHYDMDLDLDAEANTLSGDVTMTITNKTTAVLKKICIRNFAASILKDVGKGESKIEKITLEGKGELNVKTGKDPSVVYAYLSEAMKPEETISLTVSYTTDIPQIIDRFGYHQNQQGQSFQLSFCFPMLDRYEDGIWAETPYIEEGESTFNRVTDYDVTLRSKEGYLVAASGTEETKGAVTKIKAEDMRDMSIVVSNCMEKKTKIVDGIRINHYLIKGTSEIINNVCMKTAEDAVKLFNKTYGRYPYAHLDVVQTYIYGGMEFPGLVMIGMGDMDEMLGSPEYVNVHGNLSILLAHEVAHEWFYGAVGNDQYHEAWLDEGFAEYSAVVLYLRSGMEGILYAWAEDGKRQEDEYYISEATMSDENFREHMQFYIDTFGAIVNLSYEEFAAQDPYAYSDAVYTGGMVFLYELQNTMGDEKFFAAMQEYYKTYCLKEATTQDFLKIVRSRDGSDEVEKVIAKYIKE